MSEKLEPIEGLQASDFTVTKGHAPLKLCGFHHVRLPSSIGILLDTSGSMRGPNFDGLAIAKAGISQLLDTSGPQDEYFLEYVSTGPAMKCTFSCNLVHIQAALQTSAAGSTALIDAIYVALNAMHKAHHRNRALLVVSDLYDNNSLYNSQELSQAFTESPIPIFLILPVDRMQGDGHSGADIARDDLMQLINQSGGYTIRVPDREGALAAATQLAAAIRSPYMLYFQSSAPRGASHRFDLRVEVKRVRPRPWVLYKAIQYAQ